MIKRIVQPNCDGVGRKVGTVNRKAPGRVQARYRDVVCPDCGRTVAINYDGRIRHHVRKLLA